MGTAVSLVLGGLLIVVGVAGVAGTPALLNQAGRVWPRRFSRGDSASFFSAGFLVQFVSLLMMLMGAAIVVLALT